MEAAIGIMEGAFFVSKGEIISWINNLLDVNHRYFNEIYNLGENIENRTVCFRESLLPID